MEQQGAPLPFEARQFISACRIASVYCLLVEAVNFLGGPRPALMALVFCLLFLLEWMRHKALRHGLSPALQWGFALSTSVSLVLAWMLNGGLYGSVPSVFLLALFLALSVSESYRTAIFCLYLVAALFCLTLQALQPEWIALYAEEKMQFLDAALSLVTAMVAMGYGTHQFKSSYDRQRLRLQAKNQDVQTTNLNLKGLMQRNHEHLHIIAHDLRNPIGAVIGLVEVCREEYELTPPLQKDLATMEQAALQALDLVQQLSEVAYLEERKVVLQARPAELAPLLESVVRKLEPMARKKQQQLDCHLQASVTAEVDGNRMASILDNLIENAIKYSPLESKIEIHLEQQSPEVRVRVRDQGPGIPEDQRDRLFTMFGKVGTRPTGKETSTGLGLYIARMLTELHGGRLEQENLSQGCEFRLILPRKT